MKALRLWLLVVFMVSITTNTAYSSIIYQTSQPSQGFLAGHNITAWSVASPFLVNQAARITRVSFWSLEQPSTFVGSIDYAFFADNSGLPGQALSGYLTGTNLTRNFIRFDNGYNLYSYQFDITPINIDANQVYWLALHDGPISNNTFGLFFWSFNSNVGTIADANLPDLTWTAANGTAVFQLEDVATVPEPSTFLLLGASITALALIRRKSQK